jgi:hypothetical protein
LTAASSAFDVDLRRQTQGAAEEVGRGVVDTREGVITDQHDVECRGFKRTNTCLTAVSDGYIETLAVRQASMVLQTIGSSPTTKTRGT